MIATRAAVCLLLSLTAAGCRESTPAPEIIEPFEIPTAPPTPEPDESGERFVARWNAWVATLPPESNGRTKLENAINEFYEKRAEVADGAHWWDTGSAMNYAKPGDEDWEATEALFEFLEPEYEAIRSALQMDWIVGSIEEAGPPSTPLLGAPMSSTIDLVMDTSASTRNSLRWLTDRARFHSLRGDSQAALADFELAIKAAEHYSELPLLVSIMKQHFSDQMVRPAIVRALAQDPDLFDADEVALLVSLLDQAKPIDLERIVAIEFAGARWMYADVFDGHADGRLPRATRESIHETHAHLQEMYAMFDPDWEYFPPFPDNPPKHLAPVNQQLDITRRLYDSFQTLAGMPGTGDQPNPMRALFWELAKDHDTDRFYLVHSSSYSLRLVVSLIQYDRLEHRATRCVLAIHAHRLEFGEWPTTLTALSDRSVTIDPYTGEPFGYSIDADGPRLWAAGPDRDNDNGRNLGESVPDNKWFTTDEWDDLNADSRDLLDGDIVFFPPEPEPDRDDW